MACTQRCCNFRSFETAVCCRLDFPPPPEEGEEKNNERGKDCEKKEEQAPLHSPSNPLSLSLFSLPPGSHISATVLGKAALIHPCMSRNSRETPDCGLMQSYHDYKELFLLIVKTKCGWTTNQQREEKTLPSDVLLIVFHELITLKVL